jgi:hypothetical protein
MKVFRAVALDLYYFAYHTILKSTKRLLSGRPALRSLPALPAPLSLTAPQEPKDVIYTETHAHRNSEPIVYSGSSQSYVVGEQKVPLHTVPAQAFDSVVTQLAFGTSVQVSRFEGRWAHIETASLQGWVLKDALYQSTDGLFPTFIQGQSYRVDTQATVQLRRCIDDMFAGAESGSDLSSAEYVTYQLWRKGLHIHWGHARPRVAGGWQKLLRGVSGVHSGISPQTGSVMEYLTLSGGQLAYVESVAPDETITISLITEDEDAVYLEETLPRSAWIELRPVFIEVL